MTITQEELQMAVLGRVSKRLFPEMPGADASESLLTQIMKDGGGNSQGRSRQGFQKGKKAHPFDRHKVKSLLLANEHHSTCIHTKVNATVGLGHVTTEERAARKKIMDGDPTGIMILQANMGNISRTDEILDPLCQHSWQETQCDACEDFWQVGEGYIEVVRRDAGPNGTGQITGLHHLPAEEVWYVLEDDDYNMHYEVQGGEDAVATRRFACFGDLANFQSRLPNLTGASFGQVVTQSDDGPRISEVIQIRQPTSLSRWYGYSDWLAAVAPIELAQCLRQWKFDFFNNRGVPEFMLFILGQRLGETEWQTVVDSLNANIGRGNSHKSIALNLENPEIEVQLEKLALDNKGEDTFDKTTESLAMSIVTAHRVPPLLAGILVPGKLGATNELPNALIAFQTLVVGQAQRLFQQTFANTLGNPALNGRLGLTGEDFEYRRITDAYDMGSMDTMARMRQTLPEANAEGRDLSSGVKKGAPELARVAREIAKERGQDRLVELIETYIEAQAA